MPPQLVVANAPYKSFPGGVIAIRASDWIGSSVGASIETDSRAIEGEVVRETQTTSSTLLTNAIKRTAFAAAGSTLAIDMAQIPLTATSQFDLPPDPLPFFYDAYLSVVVEGTWNASDTGTYEHTPLRFDRACLVAVQGDTLNPDPDDHVELSFYPHGADSHYTMICFVGTLRFDTGAEVLTVKALARNTSTIEILLDQIVLVPTGGSTGVDMYYIAGGENTDPGFTTAIIDGPDSGDINGKFTWHPRRLNTEPVSTLIGSSAGGGDYQKDDSEYMLDVPASEGYTFHDFFQEEQNGHLYSLNGSYYRESQVHELDTFTRTVASSFGSSPKGYGYDHSSGGNATFSADGTRGKQHFTGSLPRANGLGFWTIPKILVENMAYSGTFQARRTSSLSAWWDGVTTQVVVLIALIGQDPVDGPSLGIYFDILNKKWLMTAFTDVSEGGSFELIIDHEPFSNWVDISSWYDGATGDTVGWRLEIKRYLLRAKIWDASGAEPGTWDFEGFYPIFDNRNVFAPLWVAYPYSNDNELTAAWHQVTEVAWRHEVKPWVMAGGTGYVAQWDVYYDNIEFKSDPYGNIGNVHALVESPKGEEIGRIEIPSDAWHFVYWGSGDFTSPYFDGFEDVPALDFAMKVWNDANVAELQRSEMPFVFFLAQLGGPIDLSKVRFRGFAYGDT